MLGEFLTEILTRTGGSGVPIGINVESLSIFKEEIDGTHKLFQSLQVGNLSKYSCLYVILVCAVGDLDEYKG
jgi:hypothetical protein